MSIQVTVTLTTDSADLLVGYSAGAKVYLYSSSTEDGVYTLVASTAIVSGTESYEFWDGLGSNTTWYKSRVGNSGGSSFSDYGDPFQVDTEIGYTDIVMVKRHLKITGTSDDGYLVDCVSSANAWLAGEVGRFIGPSTDLERTFDMERDSPTLMIGGGVRAVTTLEYKTAESGSFSTITDYVLRPKESELLPGMVFDRIELLASGTSRTFHAGRDMVRVTGTFGPTDPPAALSRIATTIAVWMYQSRSSGAGGVIGSNEFGDMVVNRVLTGADIRTIKLYRNVGPSMYAYPAF